jgi:DNA-directed RNA polymerase subunit RPC12/RpoP
MKRLFYIDYPQVQYEGQAHRYHCAFCKLETTKINGRLEGHLPSCGYRIELEKAGFEPQKAQTNLGLNTSDEED